MNIPVDTLAFAEKFEGAGIGHDQARLAAASGQAHEGTREGLVTKDHLDARLAEMEARLSKQIADNGKDISGRLWSVVTIIAGVSTAISATVGAVVALLLRSGGV